MKVYSYSASTIHIISKQLNRKCSREVFCSYWLCG